MNNISSQVRVRFAPSPTGHLHMGALRTIIFNWLFARHDKGKFLLRIEDTDPVRSKQEYTDSILASMKWMSVDYDEPVVIQSQRFAEHARIIEQLIQEGKAYRCFCADVHEEHETAEAFKRYPGTCRNRAMSAEDAHKTFVVRFKVPENQKISFDDVIHGEITFESEQLDDFVLARSDGTPMYNFVVVVDDAYMKITHVIRGEEHISNTPKQILLYRACNYALPVFAHLPLILGPDGKKLSKRQAATAVLDYKAQGYLPDALFNYLVRLGWAHGDQEVFSRQELIDYFTLQAVGKKAAIFDVKKLEWLNGMYIRQLSSQEVFERITRDVDHHFAAKISVFSHAHVHMLIDLYKERSKTLLELAQDIISLSAAPTLYEEAALMAIQTPNLVSNMQALSGCLDHVESFTAPELSVAVKNLSKELSIKLVDLAQPIRVALTGKVASPSVFELLSALGKRESLHRLSLLVKRIEDGLPR